MEWAPGWAQPAHRLLGIRSRVESLGVGAQSSISRAPPWPLQARKSTLCPEAPQREGAASLARLPREGWRVLKEAGGCAASSWKGSLTKTPEPDHLEERLTVPMCDKGQEIPQVR